MLSSVSRTVFAEKMQALLNLMFGVVRQCLHDTVRVKLLNANGLQHRGIEVSEFLQAAGTLPAQRVRLPFSSRLCSYSTKVGWRLDRNVLRSFLRGLLGGGTAVALAALACLMR